MIKKEFNEVGKQTLFFISTMMLFPLLVRLALFPGTHASYWDVFFPLFQLGLIFWSLFLGISLFSIERGNRGMEYILSLPFSRMKLLCYKLLPRVGSLIFFYALFVFLYGSIGTEWKVMTIPSFSHIYFMIFIVSLSFSILQDNFIVSFMSGLITTTIIFIIIFLIYRLAPAVKWGGAAIEFEDIFSIQGIFYKFPLAPLALICMALPFIISFFLAFSKFDLRPVRSFNARYFKLFIPLIIVGLILSSIIVFIDAG